MRVQRSEAVRSGRLGARMAWLPGGTQRASPERLTRRARAGPPDRRAANP